MKLELFIFGIAGFILYNIYHDGKYSKIFVSYKKYYQMAGIGFGGLMVWWLLKKNPNKANEMIATSHEYLKYLPIDQNVSNIISPILDFTSKQNFATQIPNGTMDSGGSFSMMNMLMPQQRKTETTRLDQSGKKGTKRSVSETKKKYVAARQNWKCGDCGEQLSAWFEVDHKIRLEYGGSNHIDNLVALCRECHGKKTTIENL
jgi:hypothetical protein